MKLLVTGGAGYIGSVVAHQLVEAGHETVVLDNLSKGHERALPEGARFLKGDLLDAEKVRDALSEGADEPLRRLQAGGRPDDLGRLRLARPRLGLDADPSQRVQASCCAP